MMTRFIGWVLRDSESGNAHILAICDEGVVVMWNWMADGWKAWGDQTFNEGSIQIQNAIESWERLGYDRGEPLTIEVPVDPNYLLDRHQRHSREWFDELFKPLLDIADIYPWAPAVPRTIYKGRLASISFTAAPPPGAAAGDMWFDTSANSTYMYNGGSWDTVEGIA